MNPLFFLVLVGGGVYYYDKKQKEKKKLAATTKCEGTIARKGLILLCDGTTCKGAIKDPSYVESNAETQQALDLLLRHADMVLGAKPWNPTAEQARTVLNHMMGEVFPECDWAALADSAPLGDATIGQAALGMRLALIALGQGKGGIPLPQPGEQTVDSNGLRLYRNGPICTRIVVINENISSAKMVSLFNAYTSKGIHTPVTDLDAKMALIYILSNDINGFFPNTCMYPPAQSWTFQEDENEVISWDQMVAGIKLMMEAKANGIGAMLPTPGNLGRLGQISMQAQPALAPYLG